MSSSPGIVSSAVAWVARLSLTRPCSLRFQRTTVIYLNGLVQLKAPPRRYGSYIHLCPSALLNLALALQVYAGLTFRISISFPSNYPYVAPTLKFETPCYHPNVDINGGAICLDILQVFFIPTPERRTCLFISSVHSGQMVGCL